MGSVEEFCASLLWNAARIRAMSALFVLELLPLVLEPSELLLLLLLSVLLLDELVSVEPDIIPGGGGGSAFPDPPIACAKSLIFGKFPLWLAWEKSLASWVRVLAWLEFPSEVAVWAACVRFELICAITDLYSAGLDCWSCWSWLIN